MVCTLRSLFFWINVIDYSFGHLVWAPKPVYRRLNPPTPVLASSALEYRHKFTTDQRTEGAQETAWVRGCDLGVAKLSQDTALL